MNIKNFLKPTEKDKETHRNVGLILGFLTNVISLILLRNLFLDEFDFNYHSTIILFLTWAGTTIFGFIGAWLFEIYQRKTKTGQYELRDIWYGGFGIFIGASIVLLIGLLATL